MICRYVGKSEKETSRKSFFIHNHSFSLQNTDLFYEVMTEGGDIRSHEDWDGENSNYTQGVRHGQLLISGLAVSIYVEVKKIYLISQKLPNNDQILIPKYKWSTRQWTLMAPVDRRVRLSVKQFWVCLAFIEADLKMICSWSKPLTTFTFPLNRASMAPSTLLRTSLARGQTLR